MRDAGEDPWHPGGKVCGTLNSGYAASQFGTREPLYVTCTGCGMIVPPPDVGERPMNLSSGLPWVTREPSHVAEKYNAAQNYAPTRLRP